MTAPQDERGPDVGPDPARPEPPIGLDYARRVYDRVADWYKVAETKAQLLLTANGAFAAIFFGLASANGGKPQTSSRIVGVETWCFLAVAVLAFSGAVGLAAAALLSRHQHNIDTDFARLGVRPDDPTTYKREAVWYFGHIASMEYEPTVNLLRTADQHLEFETLTYNVVGLSHVVLRKHRLVNAGWFLTACSILAMIAASLSIFLRG
jgi:hypothetical protein